MSKKVGSGEGEQEIYVFAENYDEESEGLMFIHHHGGDVAFALNRKEGKEMLEDMRRETGMEEIECFLLVKVSFDN